MFLFEIFDQVVCVTGKHFVISQNPSWVLSLAIVTKAIFWVRVTSGTKMRQLLGSSYHDKRMTLCSWSVDQKAHKSYACYKKNVCVTGHRFNTSGGLNTD